MQEVCLVTQIEIQKGIQGKKGPVALMERKLNRDKLCYILERKTGVGKTKPGSRKYSLQDLEICVFSCFYKREVLG